MTTYEAWEDHESTTLATREGAEKMKASGLIGEGAELLWAFDAATLEEARAIHSLRMGYGPHKPQGEPDNCPKCDAWFYPEASGECWRCGPIC